MSLLEKYWREDSFEYRLRADEFKKQGKEVLSDYFQFISENPLNVVGVEKHFSYVMKDLNVNISGKIDRIDKVGDSLNIIDYKTSRKKEKAKNNIQLALYIQAINNGALSDIPGSAGNAILHYLRFGDDPISSHQFSDSELEEYSEKIRKVAEGIRSKTFETKKSDFNCKNCDYKEFLCPAWEE